MNWWSISRRNPNNRIRWRNCINIKSAERNCCCAKTNCGFVPSTSFITWRLIVKQESICSNSCSCGSKPYNIWTNIKNWSLRSYSNISCSNRNNTCRGIIISTYNASWGGTIWLCYCIKIIFAKISIRPIKINKCFNVLIGNLIKSIWNFNRGKSSIKIAWIKWCDSFDTSGSRSN